MRSGNPALKDNTFLDLGSGTLVRDDAGAMSINGTVNKTGFLLLLTMLTAAFAWTQAFSADGQLAPGFSVYVWGGAIGGLVIALVTVFKKEWAPVTAPPRCARQSTPPRKNPSAMLIPRRTMIWVTSRSSRRPTG